MNEDKGATPSRSNLTQNRKEKKQTNKEQLNEAYEALPRSGLSSQQSNDEPNSIQQQESALLGSLRDELQQFELQLIARREVNMPALQKRGISTFIDGTDQSNLIYRSFDRGYEKPPSIRDSISVRANTEQRQQCNGRSIRETHEHTSEGQTS